MVNNYVVTYVNSTDHTPHVFEILSLCKAAAATLGCSELRELNFNYTADREIEQAIRYAAGILLSLKENNLKPSKLQY